MPLKNFCSGFTAKLRKEKEPGKTTSGQDSAEEDCYRETTKLRKHAVVGELEETNTAISTYEKSSRYPSFALSFVFLFYRRLSNRDRAIRLSVLPADRGS